MTKGWTRRYLKVKLKFNKKKFCLVHKLSFLLLYNPFIFEILVLKFFVLIFQSLILRYKRKSRVKIVKKKQSWQIVIS